MTTDTLAHAHAALAALAVRIASGIVRHARRLSERIDAQPPDSSHRMGAWEISVSPAAQRAVKAMQRAAAAQKEEHD